MEVIVKIKVKDGVEIELTAEEVEALRAALDAFGEKETRYVPGYYPWWPPYWMQSDTITWEQTGNDYTVTLLAAG